MGQVPLPQSGQLAAVDAELALLLAAGVVLLASGGWALSRGLRQLRPAIHILREDPLAVQDLVYQDGPAEIEGTAKGDEKGVKAPFSGTVCLAHEYEVQELRSSGQSNSWQTIDEGSKAAPFLVEDETGAVQVDGRVAELHLDEFTLRLNPGDEPPERVAKYIQSTEDVDSQDKSIDLGITELNYGNDQKFIERRLDMDDSVHVYGHVGRAPAGEWGSRLVDAMLTASEQTPLIISDTSERGAAWRIFKSRLLWPAAGLILLGIGGYLLGISLLPLLF